MPIDEKLNRFQDLNRLAFFIIFREHQQYIEKEERMKEEQLKEEQEKVLAQEKAKELKAASHVPSQEPKLSAKKENKK